MVFDRPSKPGSPRSNPATGRPNSTKRPNSSNPKKVITVGSNRNGSGGNRRGRGGNGGGGGRSGEPSPWLLTPEFQPAPSASFVEYLRWMRSPTGNKNQDANTKVQLLQLAEDDANYQARLTKLTKRTRQIASADGCFQARCSWRLRVGGHRGPESTLLPAFDSFGMPFIPSSTLRGVARTQAIRHFIVEGDTWQSAEKKVAPFFGSLEEKKESHTGKVIFLDAYPLPAQSGEKGGLAVDMANNIWSWNTHDQMDYSPNPNAFISLKESTFLIGLRREIGRAHV